MEEKIIAAYKAMLVKGDEEINSFTLSKRAEVSEKEFFELFTSPDDVARRIWSNIGKAVAETLHGSDLYNSYPPRQKVLSYYFTFFEVALTERMFIELSFKHKKLLSVYQTEFKEFMRDVVQEGIANDDIKERLSLSNYYPEVLWELQLRLISFWLNDSSENFTDTEKAVEIYSRVPLELMGHNILDSVLETVKFGVEKFNLPKVNIFKS